jgi:scyllo-inositol 2-dehydrogenase (NADP+)
MPISVGLVGFGLSARVLHTPLILGAGMTIVGVVTRQEAQVRERIPGARVLPDLESLLALDPLDLVVIATPNELHMPQALLSLKHGKHTLVDKPLALSTREAEILIAAAEASGRTLAVFQNRRWDGDFLTIQRLIASALLGDIMSFQARWDRYRPEIQTRWRESAAAGGGVLYDLGSHLIDQALCLFGMPEWLDADVFTQRTGASVDDGFEIRMGIGPLRISLGANSLVADHASRYRLHGCSGSYSKNGLDVQEQQLRNGLAVTDADFGVEPVSQSGYHVRGGETVGTALVSERGRWVQFYHELRSSIETGSAVPVTAYDARDTLAIIEAARRSSQGGCRIDFRA